MKFYRSESDNEDYEDYYEREYIRKQLEKRAKDGEKYLIFVVALPLIGALGLSFFGAMNYKYNFGAISTPVDTTQVDTTPGKCNRYTCIPYSTK